MQNLIAILYKYSSFFLFLLLQVVCFSLLFSNRNSYHHSVFASSSNSVVGSVYSMTSSVTEYFNLSEENKQLIAENIRLKNQVKGHTIKVGELYSKVDDTLRLKQYQYLPVEVIRSVWNLSHNSITINKGTSQNVKEDMGVVGTKGVVGRTIASSSNYTVVMPIINTDFELAIRHQNSLSFGMLKWEEGDDYRVATVYDIPEYVEVNKGDTIITSGADGLFPIGEVVGIVKEAIPVSGSTYQKLKVVLIEDYSKIYEVKVIKNIIQQEQKELEQSAQGV